MEICGTSIVTFETEVANFENDIASEKQPKNQNAFIKISVLGVILLGKEFYTHQCTQHFHFLEIIDRTCCVLSGPPFIAHNTAIWPLYVLNALLPQC